MVDHASSRVTHDKRLLQVLVRMKAAKLTLNWAKCKIGLTEMELFVNEVNATKKATTTREVERASGEDAELQQLRKCTGTWVG